MIVALVLAAVLVCIVFWIISIYNKLVTLKNRYKNSYAQIDVQLNRRYDLIPNLVESAKGYLKHENETLTAVISARNSASAANSQLANDPSNTSQLKNLMGAEAALGGALGKFFALAESYPDLKANQTISQLMEELATTENKIAFARQAFNDAAMFYNTARETFPNNFVTGFGNFSEAVLFVIENNDHRKNVEIKF